MVLADVLARVCQRRRARAAPASFVASFYGEQTLNAKENAGADELHASFRHTTATGHLGSASILFVTLSALPRGLLTARAETDIF